MALHDKASIQHKIEDQVYASVDLSVSLPKYQFPQNEQEPRHAYAVVRDELMLDGNARQNLATFCQTWEEPELHQLMDDCINKNLVDKDEYPQTAEIEARCVHMLGDLWHSPSGANTVGCSTVGSSEAAMLGGMAMKRRWEASRKAAGKPIGAEVSMLKIKGTEIRQTLTELTIEALGYYASPFEPEQLTDRWNEPPIGPDHAAAQMPQYLFSRAATIYGGSNEIQRNIIAKMVLGL